MRRTIRILWGLFLRNWLSIRTIMACLLGMVLTVQPCIRYITYANALKEPINLVEPFIIAGSTAYLFTFSLLGFFLLISNAPFVSNFTTYLLLRANKFQWYSACILYIWISTIIYYAVLMIITIIISTTAGTFSNTWSNPLTLLANQSPTFAERTFRISFQFPRFIQSFSPIQACIITFAFNTSYAAMLGLILYTGNLLVNGFGGWILTMTIHIWSYLVQMNGPTFLTPGLSLIIRAMPATAFIGPPYPNLHSNAIVIISLFFVVLLIGFAFLKRCDLIRGRE